MSEKNIEINADGIRISADKVNLIGVPKNNKVKIGYKEYEIVKEPEIISLPSELYGEINYEKEQIRISSKYSQKQQNQTFLHELIHGMFEKLDMTNLKEDEVVVNQLATTLYEVILDNPHIFTMKDI